MNRPKLKSQLEVNTTESLFFELVDIQFFFSTELTMIKVNSNQSKGCHL